MLTKANQQISLASAGCEERASSSCASSCLVVPRSAHVNSVHGPPQGTKPEVRTYNTIINACNRAGQPKAAMRVYERMLADGAQPTATTYTALISAYGKTGKVGNPLLFILCQLRIIL